MMDLDRVIAVDPYAGHAVAPRAFGHAYRYLLAGRHRYCIAIVLAKEDHRQLVDAGEGQRFMEVTLRGASLAKARQTDGVGGIAATGQGLHLEREPDAGGVQDLAGDAARAGYELERGLPIVPQHLASAA